jgi:hypothetical protein
MSLIRRNFTTNGTHLMGKNYIIGKFVSLHNFPFHKFLFLAPFSVKAGS